MSSEANETTFKVTGTDNIENITPDDAVLHAHDPTTKREQSIATDRAALSSLLNLETVKHVNDPVNGCPLKSDPEPKELTVKDVKDTIEFVEPAFLVQSLDDNSSLLLSPITEEKSSESSEITWQSCADQLPSLKSDVSSLENSTSGNVYDTAETVSSNYSLEDIPSSKEVSFSLADDAPGFLNRTFDINQTTAPTAPNTPVQSPEPVQELNPTDSPVVVNVENPCSFFDPTVASPGFTGLEEKPLETAVISNSASLEVIESADSDLASVDAPSISISTSLDALKNSTPDSISSDLASYSLQSECPPVFREQDSFGDLADLFNKITLSDDYDRSINADFGLPSVLESVVEDSANLNLSNHVLSTEVEPVPLPELKDQTQAERQEEEFREAVELNATLVDTAGEDLTKFETLGDSSLANAHVNSDKEDYILNRVQEDRTDCINSTYTDICTADKEPGCNYINVDIRNVDLSQKVDEFEQLSSPHEEGTETEVRAILESSAEKLASYSCHSQTPENLDSVSSDIVVDNAENDSSVQVDQNSNTSTAVEQQDLNTCTSNLSTKASPLNVTDDLFLDFKVDGLEEYKPNLAPVKSLLDCSLAFFENQALPFNTLKIPSSIQSIVDDCEEPSIQPISDDCEEPLPTQPIGDDCEEPSLIQPIADDCREPSPNQPIADDSQDRSLNQPITGDCEEPSPIQPIADDCEESSSIQPIFDGCEEPLPTQPIVDDCKEPSLIQPIADDCTEPSPNQPIADDCQELSLKQLITGDCQEPSPIQPIADNCEESSSIQPISDDSEKLLPTQPIVDYCEEPSLIQPISDDYREPSPNQPIADDCQELSLNQPITGGCEEPSRIQPIADDCQEPSLVQTIAYDCEEPSPIQPIADSCEESSIQPIADDCDPYSTQSIADDCVEPSSTQPITDDFKESLQSIVLEEVTKDPLAKDLSLTELPENTSESPPAHEAPVHLTSVEKDVECAPSVSLDMDSTFLVMPTPKMESQIDQQWNSDQITSNSLVNHDNCSVDVNVNPCPHLQDNHLDSNNKTANHINSETVVDGNMVVSSPSKRKNEEDSAFEDFVTHEDANSDLVDDHLMDDQVEEIGVAAVNRRSPSKTRVAEKEKPVVHSAESPIPLSNQSEAGPEVAEFTEEEFKSAAEIFKDPSTFEFLQRAGNTKALEESSLSRLSLYVKFDPLVAQKSAEQKRLSTFKKPVVPQKKSGTGGLDCSATEVISVGPEGCTSPPAFRRDSDDNQLIQLSPNITANVTKPNLKMVPVEPVQRIVNDCKTVFTEEDMKKALQINDLLFQERLIKKDKEMSEKEQGFAAQSSTMKETQKSLQQAVIFTRTMLEETGRIVRKWQEKKELERVEATKERDQALEDLRSVESSFSELHRRYEKIKGVLEGYKQNEEGLRVQLLDTQDKLRNQEQKYEALKCLTQEKLESANVEIENAKKVGGSEIAVLRSQLMKAEMKITSLEKSLDNKSQEFAQLTDIYDDLIARVSGGQET